VIQELFLNFPYEVVKGLISKVTGSYVKLSNNQFSSKPVEYCIKLSPLEKQILIVDEFCSSQNLHSVVEGDYGNYVLQNSLDQYLKSNELKVRLIDSIINCIDKLKNQKTQIKWCDKILAMNIKKLEDSELGTSDSKIVGELRRKLAEKQRQVRKSHIQKKQGQNQTFSTKQAGANKQTLILNKDSIHYAKNDGDQ